MSERKTEFPERISALKASLAWIKSPKSNRELIFFLQYVLDNKVLSREQVFADFPVKNQSELLVIPEDIRLRI